MSELLRIEDLNFSYEDRIVLQNFHLIIDSTIPTLLCGNNGVGKSTVLNIISGVIKIAESDGRFYWSQQKTTLTQIQSNIAYLQSSPALFVGLSGHENIKLCSMLFHEPAEYEQEVFALCNWIGLSKLDLSKDIAKYSQGMLQKLWLAIILKRKKALYLVDEPFNSLDSDSVSRLCEFLLNQGRALLIVAHEPPQSIIGRCHKIIMPVED